MHCFVAVSTPRGTRMHCHRYNYHLPVHEAAALGGSCEDCTRRNARRDA